VSETLDPNPAPELPAVEADAAKPDNVSLAESVVSAIEEHVGDLVSQQVNKAPLQSEMPFAMVQGKAYTQLPQDLYIPPDALEVFLEAFEGPLDLLLYLIRKQNLDILDINVSEITSQYMAYVELMEAHQFELAAEYLVMAAMLAEIKSRMLLPRSSEEQAEEEDPRASLIRRLQEYERFKQAALDLDKVPRVARDVFPVSAAGPDRNLTRLDPDVELQELLLALSEVLRRADMFESHHVSKENFLRANVWLRSWTCLRINTSCLSSVYLKSKKGVWALLSPFLR
jgi:segregation and condensation protein A